VRHPSFRTPEFIKLLRESGVGAVFTEAEDSPSIADFTGDVVYARLQRGDDAIPTAYPLKALDEWAVRARTWAIGGIPDDLPLVEPTKKKKTNRRDVLLSFIKEGNLPPPAAAMALIERLP